LFAYCLHIVCILFAGLSPFLSIFAKQKKKCAGSI